MSAISRYDHRVLRDMFDGKEVSPVLPYTNLVDDREAIAQITEGIGRVSLSGVQPKYAMVVDDGQLRFTKEGERGTYILKPAPTASFLFDRQYCPANEYLTMQLAREVYKIPTAACCLCFFGDGTEAYLTRRFDIDQEGQKLQQEDFASIAGVSKATHGDDYKYEALSYEDCAALIDKHVKAAMVEKLRFFRLVVFNYLTLNDDAHLKNFSLIAPRNGDYVLSPAYDLLNTSLHLPKPQIFALTKGLFREGMPKGDVYPINRATFALFGKKIGLTDRIVDRELTFFGKEHAQAREMIENSRLSDELKTQYWKSFDYRRLTLTW